MSEPRSYYGRPILKAPVWTWEVPVYFWVGGMAGASAGLGWSAHVAGNEVLARNAWRAAMAGIGLSPPLLIADLGRPERFLNMLRMVKVTSPMSMGSWILQGAGAAVTASFAHSELGRFPRVAAVARPGAAAFGLALTTYTGALLSATSIPVWHEARRELPFVFAGGGAASAGGLASILTPVAQAGPARRLAVGGALAEVAAATVMERRLGDLAAPLREERWSKISLGLTLGGAAMLAGPGRRSRVAAAAGGGAVALGALAERWAIYKAGFASAKDPKYVVGPQRERMAA
ncbi:MAG: NrfD/PsrC family molybdoenzyme membrane anchor subunit [Solirubrobacteraceae bacterium]